MRKKPTIYIIIVCVWIVCAGLLIGSCAHIADFLFSTEGINAKSVLMALLLMSNSLMLSYMWLGSVKDFMFSFVFFLRRKKILGRYESIISIEPDESLPKPKFLLLYCTCNDFNEKALEACMRQDYENFETIILDDSSKSEYLKRIDDFAERPGVTVARRSDRAGFKAGNLNHYLQGRTDYDYFVVLDSDEVIPENYIKEVLKYYAYSPEVGVVQAAHQASEGENAFQSLMGLSVRSNGQICQVMKNFYGSNALIGHGMTISRACYEATHGFPAVVAEDISFAVDVKNSGYRVLYAPNILCTEEFPVNYICLKKRQAKWVQGNVEFMKKYGKSIAYSKMTWYEKLDVKLSHYNLPIIPMLSFFIILNAIFMGFLGFNIACRVFRFYHRSDGAVFNFAADSRHFRSRQKRKHPAPDGVLRPQFRRIRLLGTDDDKDRISGGLRQKSEIYRHSERKQKDHAERNVFIFLRFYPLCRRHRTFDIFHLLFPFPDAVDRQLLYVDAYGDFDCEYQI